MGGGGNDPEFWGELIWQAIAIVGAFILTVAIVGVLLIVFAKGGI